jgi:UDP-N-acetylmuramoyl-tripeptide--D-alanyl-D-alanine ligase
MKGKLSFRKRLSFYKTSLYKKPYHLLIRFLAKWWLKLNPRVRIIAVVGSFGKTTTTQVISFLLSSKAPAIASDINLDTVYNIPLTILKLRPWRHRYLILEVGVDHKDEKDFHLQLFRPDVVVLTGITPVHADRTLMGSLERIMKEKRKILDYLPGNGQIIANFDDPKVVSMVQERKNVLFYSLKDQTTDFYAQDIKTLISQGGKLRTKFTLKSKKGASLSVIGKFLGKQFVQSFLAAAAVAFEEGIGLEAIGAVVNRFRPLPGRMSIEKISGNILLINDSLRSNPASVRAGLEALSSIPKMGVKRKIALLGEMGELGKYAVEEHQKVGRLITSLGIDFFIGVGPLMKIAVEKAKEMAPDKAENFYQANDVVEAVDILKRSIGISASDILYLKGSLLKHMERVIFLLSGERVDCRVVSCPFYHSCRFCRYRQSKED